MKNIIVNISTEKLNKAGRKVISIVEKDFIWGSRLHHKFLRGLLLDVVGYQSRENLNAAISSLKEVVQFSVDAKGKWVRMVETDYLKMLLDIALGDVEPICQPIACNDKSDLAKLVKQNFGLTLPKQVKDEFSERKFTFSK